MTAGAVDRPAATSGPEMAPVADGAGPAAPGGEGPPWPPLPLLVFVEGAATLGAEIAATRLLAPYFGDSTIVWANTIAIVLVALAGGYWFGGRLADRRPRRDALCRLVVVAAVILAVVPFVAHPLLGVSVSAFDSLSIGSFAGSLFGVLVLVAIPIFLFGCVSPWAIRIQVETLEDSGRQTGRLYAISTLGSLAGNFAAVLLLIPTVGVQRTFIVLAALLATVAVLALPRRWLPAPLVLWAALALPVGSVKPETRAGDRVVEERETAYQYARVVQSEDGSRVLELNEGQAVHSIRPASGVLVGGYWDRLLVDPLVRLGRPPRSMAILGSAAGTAVRAYGELLPATGIDAVEIDGDLVDIGRRWFGLHDRPGLRLIRDDARPFLRRTARRYDAIVVDAYHQPYIPFYLSTREFFALVRARLNPGGVLLINIGHPEGQDGLERMLSATVGVELPNLLRDPVNSESTVLIASEGPLAAGRLSAAAGRLPPALRPVAAEAAALVSPALRGGPIFTDDRAPVEWLVDGSLVAYATGG